MTATQHRFGGPEAMLDALPAPLVIPDVLARINEHTERTGMRTVALDDDPTGTQTLHGVKLLSQWHDDDIRWAVSNGAPGLSVVLTNSRSLSSDETSRLTRELAGALESESTRQNWPLRIVSRGDSTLRGHVPLETDTLCEVAKAHGRPYDAVLFTPAYLEAGRITVGDVQWVRTGPDWIPVGDSEYAGDATFGFRSSNLRDYLEEKSAGRWSAASIPSIDLETIRSGGPEAVAAVLVGLGDGQPVVVNAASVHDLEVVALAVTMAERAGRRLLHRLAPSLLRLLAGQAVRAPLTSAEIYAGGTRSGHGLVVVGSHTANTSRQLERVASMPGVTTVELDVPALEGSSDAGAAQVSRVVRLVVDGLGAGDVVLQTSRARLSGEDDESSLTLAARVSRAITDVVRQVRERASLRFVIAKGGITSHDVAVHGLGIRRAVVAGQLFNGIVSVFTTVEADVELGLPYVVFPGNVGDEDSLAQAIAILASSDAEGSLER